MPKKPSKRRMHELAAGMTAWADEVMEPVWGAVHPLFVRGDHPQPQFVGSGVLIQLWETPILVTAAHVLDKGRGLLHIMTPRGRIRPILRRPQATPLPASGDREDDELDVAVIPIPDPIAQQFGAESFLSISNLDLGAIKPPPQNLILLGFPARRQRRPPTEPPKKAALYTLFAGPSQPAVYAELNLRRDQHILVDFDKSDSWRATGPVTAPDPYGTSGGGVWFVEREHLGGPWVPRLAGIARSWRVKQPKCIIATRLMAGLKAVTQYQPPRRAEP